MSNVPGYLQHIERGDNFQEKALNFGVLGWQRLENWTDKHRRMTINKKVATSPESSNSSSAFSTFGLSSKSCSSSGSKHATSTNQPPLNFCRDSFSEQDYAPISKGVASRYGMGDHNPEKIACSKCLARGQICGSAEQCLPIDNSVAELEENKRNIMDFQAAAYDAEHFLGASTLPSRSEDCAASPSINEKLKTLNFVSDCGDKCEKSAPGCHNHSFSTSVNCPEDHCSELSQLNDVILDYAQESIQGSQRFSFGSVESAYTIRTESGHKSFVGSIPYEEFQTSTPYVPHSCPLTSDVHRSEWSNMNVCASEHGQHEKHIKTPIKPYKLYGSKTHTDWSWNGVKGITTTGTESLYNNLSHAGLNGMVRRSRSRDTSDRKPKWMTSSNGHNGGKAVDSCRAWHSPFRRMMDPLLKPKASNRTHMAKSAAGSPRQLPCESKLLMQEELSPTCELYSSTKVSTHSCGSTSLKGFISSTQVSKGKYGSVLDEKHEPSMKQTLLQLAWKKGLPLLTFSVNESDILSATRKRGTPGEEDCEFIYTLYIVCETKKKTDGWISQGNKSKRRELISSIVGQVNVSCIRGHKNHFAPRQFVLFGPELRPSVNGSLQPLLDSELAAIVVKIPDENVESFVGDLPQKSNHRDLSERKLETDKCAFHTRGRSDGEQDMEKSAPKIVAILPSEVHGLSDTGKPSSLVDWWKTQGLCDCGGWDVGCSLRILTNNLRDSRPGSLHSLHTTDGTHRVEFAIQDL